jgi:hypothetical protein
MKEDVRYKMQHLGDIFVDTLSCVADSARKHAKGVVLTYDIRDLKKKRREYLGLIGRRIVLVKKAGLADLRRDDKLVEMIAHVEKIDRFMASLEEKKKGMASGRESRTASADSAA